MLPGPVSNATTSLGQSARRNRRKVADAAEILHDATITAMAVEHVIKEWHQRRALAAGSHIGRTKVGNDRHAEPGRDDCCLAGLPCAGNPVVEEQCGVSLVIERLPVTADQFGFQVRATLSGANGIRVEVTEKEIEPRKIGDARCACVHQLENGTPDLGWVRELIVGQQLQAGAESSSLDAHQRDVDPIGRGAAHHARDDHAKSSP